MKKITYLTTLTIITIVCIVLGSIKHIGGYFFGLNSGWFIFSGFNTDTSVQSDSFTLDEFESISLDTSVMNITIKEGDDYNIEYRCTKKLIPEIKVKNGKLSVSQNVRITSFLKNNGECSATITIPYGTELINIDLDPNIGNATLDGITAKELDLCLDVGTGNISNCTFEKTEVDAAVGEIRLEHCDLGKCELSTDTGNIYCTSSLFTDIDIYNSLGNIQLEYPESRTYSIKASTDLGDVHVDRSKQKRDYKGMTSGENSDQTYKIEINNDLGDIEVNGWSD